MTNINLEKVAQEFSGAILFDGANSFKVIQASDYIDFYETEVRFRGETSKYVDSNVIYQTTESDLKLNPEILNKSTKRVNEAVYSITEKLKDLTEYEIQELKNRLIDIIV